MNDADVVLKDSGDFNRSRAATTISNSEEIRNHPPKDIQILVSRPSPIREIPPSAAKATMPEDNHDRDLLSFEDQPDKRSSTINGSDSVTAVGTSIVRNDICRSPSSDSLNVNSSPGFTGVSTPADNNSSSAPSMRKRFFTDSVDRPPCDHGQPRPEVASLLTAEVGRCEFHSGDDPEREANHVSPVHRGCERDVDQSLRRIRPISGPATAAPIVEQLFDTVRKTQSVTDNLDSADPLQRCVSAAGAAALQGVPPLHDFITKGIRRAHSSITFDRMRIEKLIRHQFPVHGFAVASPAGMCQRPSGVNRSRHTSGLETPISMIDTNSIASTGEGGWSFFLFS